MFSLNLKYYVHADYSMARTDFGSTPPPSRRGPTFRHRVETRLLFSTSAVFHYLGPSFAVLLFSAVPVLGVAWLRIATAAAVYAGWRRPWRILPSMRRPELLALVVMSAVLSVMNACFYLAISELPLATVGSIEFLSPVGLALVGLRSLRNAAAFVLAIVGAYLLSAVVWADQPLGLLFAFANAALFGGYIVIGYRFAQSGPAGGIDRVGMSMILAVIFITPIGLGGATGAFLVPMLLGAGAAVGVCSSVVPYAIDQITMGRLPRASFALMLSLLPATATVIGLLVLGQVPTLLDLAGIALVMAGIAVHEERLQPPSLEPGTPVLREVRSTDDDRGDREDSRYHRSVTASAWKLTLLRPRPYPVRESVTTFASARRSSSAAVLRLTPRARLTSDSRPFRGNE